jgi:fatty acid CoA ligase FadD9
MTRLQLMFTDAVCRRAEDVIERHPELRQVMPSPDDLAFIRKRATSSAENFALACERYAERECFREAGEAVSYAALWRRVTTISYAWTSAGLVGPGTRVGIYHASGVHWVIADLACLVSGAVSVPLPVGATVDELRVLVEHAALSVIVCGASRVPQLAHALAGSSPCRTVVVIPDAGTSDADLEVPPTCRVVSFTELERAPAPDRIEAFAFDADQPVTVMYTSGSTGRPKGVLLTERRWRAHVQTALSWPPFPHVQIGYLSPSAITGRRIIFETMMHGGLMSFATGVLPFDDIPVVRPTLFPLVPRTAAALYQRFQIELLARHGPITEPSFDDPRVSAVLDEMSGVALGDRLCLIRVGSGSTPPDVLEFLARCFRVHIVDNYGQTETGSIAVNRRVLPNIDYKLVDVPELGYSTSDPRPRGELVIRSDEITPGYLDDPEATAGLFEPDGYLRTGDIVEEQEPGLLAWIDRRKAVVKLAQGVFVAPTRLEAMYVAGSPFIQQMYLYANPQLAFLLAVIVPDRRAFSERGAASDPEIRRILRGEIDRIARAEHLRSHDVPRDFLVEYEPFSEANQLLAESGKQSPRNLRERYAARLDVIADDVERRQLDTKERPADGSVASVVRTKLATVLGIRSDELDSAADLSFIGFGGDSVSALRFCALVESALGVSVPVGNVLDPSATIAGLVERVVSSVADGRTTLSFSDVHGAATDTVRGADLHALLSVPKSEVRSVITAPTSVAPKTVLLTGATGFLGRLLAVELVKRLPTDGKLICLVRGQDDRAVQARMRGALEAAAPELGAWFDDVVPRRLTFLAGDLGAPRFGMAPTAYERLLESVDAVVHNGALVNHAMSYRDLFEPNVLGSLEVARFAVERPGIAISFVSSIGVAARAPAHGAVTESDRASSLWPSRPLGGGPDDHAVGYVTSKWAGEVLLEQLHVRYGVPVNIFRCCNIGPHRDYQTHLNWTDTTNRLLFGMSATGLAPTSFYQPDDDTPPRHDILPLDTVASTIAAISTTSVTGFCTYHVSSAEAAAVSLDSLVDWVEAAGIPMRRLPHDAWFAAFQDALQQLPAASKARSPLATISRWSAPLARRHFAPIATTAFQQAAFALDQPIAVLDAPRVRAWVRSLTAPLT